MTAPRGATPRLSEKSYPKTGGDLTDTARQDAHSVVGLGAYAITEAATECSGVRQKGSEPLAPRHPLIYKPVTSGALFLPSRTIFDSPRQCCSVTGCGSASSARTSGSKGKPFFALESK